MRGGRRATLEVVFLIREQVKAGEGAQRADALVESEAYRGGWRDGRFSPCGSFAENASLAAWQDHDRLAYYRGYREGLRVREMLAGI